ncbi:NAD(P)H-dependent oxidoreductase [Actinoplanes sp. NPDC051861]|uniref:NAD(P)H-dependent oxidoreductase n=1 Tax=Actinoplanes sp. NPDC051861 TaxID=3155170 RepID=UPI003420D834
MPSVHVIFCHPDPDSFTRRVLDAFLGGVTGAGHTATVSDLYLLGFHPEMSLAEYRRESGAHPETVLPDDVAAEHAKLSAADVWAFVYPVWWNDCPALLKGWFDRVWTVGVAYRPMTLRPARKALVICTCGYDEEGLGERYSAMRTTMVDDRIGARAEQVEFHLLGGRVNGAGDRHLELATHLGRTV